MLATTLLAAASAYLISGILPKTYEAKATLIVGQSLTAVNPDYSQLLASQRLSTTYAAVATTRPLLVRVIEELGLTDTPEDLRKRIRATAAVDSTLLSITASDVDGGVAAAIANALARELLTVSPDLQGQEADTREFVDRDLKATQAQIESTQAEIADLTADPTLNPAEEGQLSLLQGRLTTLRSSYAALLAFVSNDASNLVSVVEPAVAPLEAVSPRPILNAVLAAVLALSAAIGLIAVASFLDDSLKTADDVQETVGLSTLGTIPQIPSQPGRSEIYQLVTILYPRSTAAEAYRTLRTNLEFASVDTPARTILVTSSRPGEGKTVTASNLAVVFADAGRTVLLVDADLRQPGVHKVFDLPNARGLSTVLRGDDRWESVVQATEQPNLGVLTTGPLPPNPAELLSSQRMQSVLRLLTEANELLIIDSPPLQVVTDAAILSSYVDGTVLVIDSNRTRRETVRAAREALAKTGTHVLGAVLNRLPEKAFMGYGYYGPKPADVTHDADQAPVA